MLSVTFYPVYFRFLLCYNDQDKRKKYGVIEDSNKKAERSYLPSNVLPVYSFFNSDTERVVKKEKYELRIVLGVRILFPHGGERGI